MARKTIKRSKTVKFGNGGKAKATLTVKPPKPPKAKTKMAKQIKKSKPVKTVQKKLARTK